MIISDYLPQLVVTALARGMSANVANKKKKKKDDEPEEVRWREGQ